MKTIEEMKVQAGVIMSACVRAQSSMDKTTARVSDAILELFNSGEGLISFQEACKDAEQVLKAKQAKAGKDAVIPRCWVQAKSDLIGASKAGIEIADMASVSHAKREKIKANKANKSTKTGPEKSSDDVSLTNNKLILLAEQLTELNDTAREALLDSFIAQTANAVASMQATGDVAYSVAKRVQEVRKQAMAG